MSDFNSWFKKKFRDLHDAILCGDLVAGNYKKVSKKSYEAGQQSKQKEIDELNLTIKRLITSEEDIARGCKHWRDSHRELDERIAKDLTNLLKSYNAQKSLPMLDEFNRGWVSAYACVALDLEKLVK